MEVLHFLRDAAGEPTTEASGINTDKGSVMAIVVNEKTCAEKIKQDPPYNKSGLHCGRDWDGWLCWGDTPAGTHASQNCPEYFSDFDPTEKATRYCGEDGQWFHHPETSRIWTNYTLCATTHEKRLRKLKILVNEDKCLRKINHDPPLNKSGLYCSRNWDGWLCWDDTPAGNYSSQNCPDYFFNFDPTVDEVTVGPMVNPEEQEIERKKILDSQYKCFEKMNRDPPYNKSGLHCKRNWDGWLCWDDTPAGTYTSQNCPNYFMDFDPTEKATKYCGEDGQWFRHPDTNRTWSNYTLCNENTTAKLKSVYILFYMAIVGHGLSIASLLISLAIFFYFRSLSCQRITLHKNLFCSYVLNSALTIIYLVAVVSKPEVVSRNPVGCKVLHFFHMYMLGCNYFWMLCEGIYLHTLIVVAVFAEEQHLHWYYLLGWESNMYMKAVRATLILVPLLGIQFVIFPWRPENRIAGEVYEYVMHILMHYQVQAALKRQWMQYKTQWGQRRKDHCSMRSTSYTATSITEVPAFMYHHDCNSEHLNGRHTEDSELVALKSGRNICMSLSVTRKTKSVVVGTAEEE
ncbi:Calcitonin receptor [Collichthys lucidus]|uniref:Calcitonin receptor n=1 Tax=Collichthys lucidus TaxID=240159 RepID=A0A4U5VJS7_COLLU|nr:Calcitonin receptor [Collichthys lucidus]